MAQAFQALREGHWDPVGHGLLWALVGLESPCLPLSGTHHSILLDHAILEGRRPLSAP